jgi:hypothetical protein
MKLSLYSFMALLDAIILRFFNENVTEIPTKKTVLATISTKRFE